MDSKSEPGTVPADTGPRSLPILEETTHSFIVTIRSISGRMGSHLKWRGTVEHAQSRERIYYVHLSRLNEFIAARSGIAVWRASRLKAWWRRWRQALLGRWKR